MIQSEQEVTLPGSHPASRELRERIDEPLRLLHHHAGYLRIHAKAFLQAADDTSVLTAAQTAAEAIPGFRSWSFNPKTGTVVVEYDPGMLEADDLLNHIAKRVGFRGVESETGSSMNRQELVDAFLDSVQDVNQVVSQLTGERMDLRELVPVVLAGTSVVSFVLNDDRGRLPSWDSAIYHSYRIFMQWHRREARTRERVARQWEEKSGSDDNKGKAR